MPRVKIDYIVSFSSEDPEHPASNLLSPDVSSKRWLCARGEPSCSVVLQLARAVKISAIDIGAHHTALVEVLVGRSETPNEPFQVLVPSCVFLSPAESRRGQAAGRVRAFRGARLGAAGRQRWDRLRLVCSQPYNKHCQYGLSFVHVTEGEEEPPPPPVPPPPPRDSSDEDEFRPGELFARHRAAPAAPAAPAGTEAQIRLATSQAIKNVSETAAMIVKTPISKRDPSRKGALEESEPSDRRRGGLMYTDDDDKPHAKIDRVVRRHRDEKHKEETEKADRSRESEKRDEKHKRTSSSKERDRSSREKNKNVHSSKDSDRNSSSSKEKDRSTSSNKERDGASSSKQNRHERKEDRCGKESKDKPPTTSVEASGGEGEGEEGAPLAGVVFALSGYENPARAQLRALAAGLGARYRREWAPACTHLVCAFPNTPRLRAVRAAGAPCCAVSGDWIQECARAGRRLPWRWFAAERARRRPRPAPPPPPPPPPPRDHTECDTDDEIEKVLQKQKKHKTEAATPDGGDGRDDAGDTGDTGDTARRPSTDDVDDDDGRHTDTKESKRHSSDRTTKKRAKANSESSEDNFTEAESSAKKLKTSSRDAPDGEAGGDTDGGDTDGEAGGDTDGEAGGDTDGEAGGPGGARRGEAIDPGAALPDFFLGHTFRIDGGVAARGPRPALLARYVRAYGGALLQDASLAEGDAHFVVTCEGAAGGAGQGAAGRGARVAPAWLWGCHRRRRLLPPGAE